MCRKVFLCLLYRATAGEDGDEHGLHSSNPIKGGVTCGRKLYLLRPSHRTAWQRKRVPARQNGGNRKIAVCPRLPGGDVNDDMLVAGMEHIAVCVEVFERHGNGLDVACGVIGDKESFAFRPEGLVETVEVDGVGLR